MSDLGSQTPYPAPPDNEWGTQPARAGKGSGPRAGFFARLGALILDGLVLGIPNAVLFVAVDYALANVLSLILGVAYYTYFEGGPAGQTLGKRVLGIRVIDFKAGGSIGYGRALVRYVGRILSTIVFLLGYFWMLWDPEKQTWHDKLAGSVVVPVDAYPVR